MLYPSFTNHADMKKSISIMAEVIGGDAPKIANKFNEYFDGNLKRVDQKCFTWLMARICLRLMAQIRS